MTSSTGRGLTQADFAYLERLATVAAESGLYGSGSKTRAQLLMKLIYGRDLGIPVSAALSAIDIYDGKMELSSNLIAALVEAHPHYAYAIIEATDERCELEFFKDGNSLGAVTFDAAAAVKAGLADTDYYRLYPSDMFFARAMTRGARRHCPGLGRGVAIYATGELAKRTPEPTRAPRSGNGAPPTNNGGRTIDAPRIGDEDRERIRAMATEAKLTDAELFNVLVVAAGSGPVRDEQRAARQLERALACLPVSLIEKVTSALAQRREALSAATSANGSEPAGGESDGGHR
jgi:hypothetical protein